jgi:hypothetical protein
VFHNLSCPHPYTYNTILHKNTSNALCMLPNLYPYWITPTCFSRQAAILSECWYISWARPTIYLSKCKYQIKEQRVIRYITHIALLFIYHLHLDMYFVHLADEMYRYSLRMDPWGLKYVGLIVSTWVEWR